MTRGGLIFAHNGTIDYGSQAVLSARLATKHLDIPVSLVTDSVTLENIKTKFDQLPFDQIILINLPNSNNIRFLTDHSVLAANLAMTRLGLPDNLKFKQNMLKEQISFINDSRVLAYDLTPYDQTLVFDTDFLIFSNRLNKYWDSTYDFLISPGMLNLQENTIAPDQYQINDYTIDQLWATTFIFSKTEETRIFFNLLKYIKEQYNYFAHLYNFEPRQYRNDFAFSVACHIIGGHGAEQWHGLLPCPLFFTDDDSIIDIKDNGQLTFLLGDTARLYDFLLAKSVNQDVHVMNKRNILANLDRLLELA